jgi:hypothetical protein
MNNIITRWACELWVVSINNEHLNLTFASTKGLNDQHPLVHHPKSHVLGSHGWDEIVPQGSIYLVSKFLFLGDKFYSIFFWPTPKSKFFFLEALTYTQPTYHPSSYQPTSFPHVAEPSPPCHLHSFLTLANVLLTIAIAITRGA